MDAELTVERFGAQEVGSQGSRPRLRCVLSLGFRV